jgi:ornithine cyclodeaminase/alanine dehydrogenase-like protein (mu-crystallin family)
MLYLNAEQFAQAADCDELMSAIERAFELEQSGAYSMPHRIHLEHQGNTLLYMPCFLDAVFGTKVLSLFPDNPSRGLPVISGLVLLNDAETGLPLAIIDGAAVTAYRTGAVSGLGIRYTAKKDSQAVGLIGAGAQGFYQVLFASKARELEKALIFDRDRVKAEAVGERIEKELSHLKVKVVGAVEELLAEADLVITATPATSPVLPDQGELLRNKSYVSIGSYKPEMRELPQALYRLLDQVLIDTAHGLEESGDLITPLDKGWISKDKIIPFGQYIKGNPAPRKDGETSLYKTVGMALFDLTVAESIYHKALKQDLGIKLD